MSIKERKALLTAMKIIVRATRSAEDAGLSRLLNAYNYLHRQLDGTVVPRPRPSVPVFIYDNRLQMMRTQ